MAVNLVGTITGAAVPGITTPSFTTVADSAPDQFSKAVAVQTAAGFPVSEVNSVTRPFTMLFRRPARLLQLSVQFLNGVTGKYTRVPKNTYTAVTRKGVDIASGQTDIMLIRTSIEVPAGAEGSAAMKAAVSLHAGALSSLSAGIADTLTTGVI